MSNVPQDVIDDAVKAGLIPQPSRFLDAAYFEKIDKFAQLRAQRSNADPVDVSTSSGITIPDALPIARNEDAETLNYHYKEGWNNCREATILANAYSDAGVAAGMTRAAQLAKDMEMVDRKDFAFNDGFATAAIVISESIIKSIPPDSKAASREVCMKVARTVYEEATPDACKDEELAAIVNSVLEDKS